MNQLRVLFVCVVLSVFLLVGNAMAYMVDIGDPASGERDVITLLNDAFGDEGWEQVDSDTINFSGDTQLQVVEGDASWYHEVGVRLKGGEYNLYMTSVHENGEVDGNADGTFYSDPANNADGYTHFAFFENDAGEWAVAIEDQNQDKKGRAWLDHDHNDVVAKAVPIPGAVWLLGSGLIGLLGIRRKVRH